MRPTSCPGSIARCVSTTSNCWTTPKRSSAVLKERQRPAIERARTAAAQGSDCLNQLSSLIRPIRNGAPQRCESIRTHHLANRRSARTPFILLGSGPAFGEISPTLPQADFGPAWGHSQCREITPGKSRLRQQEYRPGFLSPRSLHEVVPNLGGRLVLAADRVGVNFCGRAHVGVAHARGDGHDVHAPGQQEARVAVSQDVERGSLGKLQHPAKPGDRSRLLQKHTAPDYSTRK